MVWRRANGEFELGRCGVIVTRASNRVPFEFTDTFDCGKLDLLAVESESEPNIFATARVRKPVFESQLARVWDTGKYDCF